MNTTRHLTDRERRRKDRAKDALRRLAEGKTYSRRELFVDTEMDYYEAGDWERRFLTFLMDNDLVSRTGKKASCRYTLNQKPSPAGRHILERLLADGGVLNTLLYTTKDPLEADLDSVVEPDEEEGEEESEEKEETEEKVEEPPPLDLTGVLNLIAERLKDVVDALALQQETLEKVELKVDRLLAEWETPSMKMDGK